jgi:hypothetical protein
LIKVLTEKEISNTNTTVEVKGREKRDENTREGIITIKVFSMSTAKSKPEEQTRF